MIQNTGMPPIIDIVTLYYNDIYWEDGDLVLGVLLGTDTSAGAHTAAHHVLL